MAFEKETPETRNPQRKRKFGNRFFRLFGIGAESDRGSAETVVDDIAVIHMPPSLERNGYEAIQVPAGEGQSMYFEAIAPRNVGDFTVFQYENETTGETPWYVFQKTTNEQGAQSGIKGYLLRDAKDARIATERVQLSAVVPSDTGDGKVGLGYRLDGLASVQIKDKLQEIVVVRYDQERIENIDIENPTMLQYVDGIERSVQAAVDAYEKSVSTAV